MFAELLIHRSSCSHTSNSSSCDSSEHFHFLLCSVIQYRSESHFRVAPDRANRFPRPSSDQGSTGYGAEPAQIEKRRKKERGGGGGGGGGWTNVQSAFRGLITEQCLLSIPCMKACSQIRSTKDLSACT